MITKKPIISVCMPMYNASQYLRECIDSILLQTFTDFELLIVDDGSTDDSCDIVRSYNDSRIRLIENKHDYIASLNMLLDEAKGKYIARMDADDVMMPYRLEKQYNYMEQNIEVDVLGGGMSLFGISNSTFIPLEELTIYDMLQGCCISHPTVMIRKDIFIKTGLRYKKEFIYAEDYHLWIELLKQNVVFRNIKDVLIRYRTSEHQVSCTKSKLQQKKTLQIRYNGYLWLDEIENKVKNDKPFISASKKKLTVVIPFLNEGEEVVNTVRSIRETVRDAVEIIVVNDCSNDNYDYIHNLEEYNVHYVYNQFRIGASASKEKGAQLAPTPYFLLLDAHMRFYSNDWHAILTDMLEADDRRILCCQTKALTKKEKKVFYNGAATTMAAFVFWGYQDYIPGIRWNAYENYQKISFPKIPCVLGACYAASKRYWNYIKGYQGLVHYGHEEAYISIKTWLEGGGCTFVPNVVVGHIYRDFFPYRVTTSNMYYNLLVIADTLFPTSLRCWAHSLARKRWGSLYLNFKSILNGRKKEIESLKEYYNLEFKNSFQYIIDINNVVFADDVLSAENEAGILKEAIRFLLNDDNQDDISLYSGDMGALLAILSFLQIKSSISEDAESCEIKIVQLLDNICNKLQQEQPVSFAHGICGIGWGLIFMIRHELTDENFQSEFAIIDELVQERSPIRIKDLSFESGLGGILCYVINRIALLKENETMPFDEHYIVELKNASKRILTSSDIDFRSYSYAMMIQSFSEDSWEILIPEWKDVLDFPNFLPENKEYWRKDIKSVIGYTLKLTNVLTAKCCKM